MELSGKAREILEFLIRYIEENGTSPVVRTICSEVGLSSTSTVHGHLSRLEEKGYIRRDPENPRSIEILRRPEAPKASAPARSARASRSYASSYSHASSSRAKRPVESVIAFQDPSRGMELVAVPIIGKVRAGEPILAVENIEDYFPLPVDATRNSDCFMLRVQGESMINAGIFEGDLILVRSQKTANNRDIVVALLGDSVTVKTFYKEKDYIRLQPENDYMDPILIKDCTILGKVIGLYRTL